MAARPRPIDVAYNTLNGDGSLARNIGGTALSAPRRGGSVSSLSGQTSMQRKLMDRAYQQAPTQKRLTDEAKKRKKLKRSLTNQLNLDSLPY